MYNKSIIFKNFNLKTKNINKLKDIFNTLKKLLNENNQIVNSLKKSYKDSYKKKSILKLKKFNHIKLIGMGGSILGARAIYDFLKPKSKKFLFIDSFSKINKIDKSFKKNLNLIVSKSGNTLETLSMRIL